MTKKQRKPKPKGNAAVPMNKIVRRMGYRNEREMFDDLYDRGGLSIREIASRIGRSYTAIKYRLTVNGFGLRDRGGPNRRKP